MMPDSDFELTETSLEDDPTRPVRVISWRMIALAALALAVVIGGIAFIPPFIAGRATSVVRPVPTGSTSGGNSTTGGVAIFGVNGLPFGWHLVSPTGARAIVHSRSDLSTAYACAVNNGTVSLYGLHNSGSLLQGSGIPVADGQQCALSIDPQNAQHVAVMTSQTGTLFQCYRSFNGGASWQQETLPDGMDFSGGMLWTTDAFYVLRATPTITDYSAPRTHLVARSIGQGPFTWLDDESGFSGIRAIAAGFTGNIQGTLYVSLIRGIKQGQADLAEVVSRDQGKTWQPVTFTADGQPLTVVQALGDSNVFFGESTTRSYLSQDGGAHWVALPPQPTGVYLAPYATYIAPDGSLVTQFVANAQSDPGNQIYSTKIGDNGWQLLAPQTRDFSLLGIDWGANGQLNTLYGSAPDGALAAYTL